MKKILLILLALPFTLLLSCKNAECIKKCKNTSDISTAPLSSRLVLQEGLNVWRASYAQLVKDSVVGNSGKPDVLAFPVKDLKILHALDSKNPNISFWFYMEEDSIPKFALSNENDSTQFLIIEKGNAVKKDSAFMNPKFSKWKSWCASTKDRFVYVKLYRYNWDELFKLIDTSVNDILCIENVAHTVNSDSQIYKVPKESSNGVYVEGFVVLDIILWGAKSGLTENRKGWKVSDKFDFAMPCPKFCPM